MFAHCNDLSANYVATGIVQQKYLSTEISRRKLTKANSATNSLTMSHTHTHTHTFNSPLSRTTRVSWYQKVKTNLDFTEARGSEWQWHWLGHMHVCTLLQTDNNASTQPLSFFQARCPSCCPTNSVKALKAIFNNVARCYKRTLDNW